MSRLLTALAIEELARQLADQYRSLVREQVGPHTDPDEVQEMLDVIDADLAELVRICRACLVQPEAEDEREPAAGPGPH